MQEGILTTIILPASLFVIMLGMGLSLVIDDFKRVIRYPLAVSVGLINQIILLPIIGYLLTIGLNLEATFAVGLMILAACPGGVTSNLITHVARGDTALSITLTAISSFITVISIPIIISWSLNHFIGESKTVELPVLQTIGQIIAITILPVSIGMFIRRKRPLLADQMEKPARTGSTILFVIIVLGILLSNWDSLLSSIKQLGMVTLLLNIITMLVGYLAARLLGLELPQTLSISIESGVQNGTLAIVIATSILKQADMALPAGVYSLAMFLTGGILMYYFGNRLQAKKAEVADHS